MNSVLIIDDNKDILDLLASILGRAGYKTNVADDGETALKAIARKSPDVVLLDLRLPGMDGFALLEQIRKISPASNVIMLTGHGGVKDAVKAMKLGAFDFIGKPFDNDELLVTVKRACENINLRRELEQTRAQLDAQTEIKEILGESPAIRTVLKLVRIVAPTNMTVILQGESGVGKEVIANLIHQHSRRRDKPFVPVDCGTIPDQLTESILFGHEKGSFTGADNTKEGQFERAHEGTIFLDEIVNTSEAVQMKMLRVVQEKKLKHLGGKSDIPVDVRIITASNINLDEAVKKGKLRADLFHRFNEFVINVPPLRERRDDIPLLAHQFLLEANFDLQKNLKGFSVAAIKLLLDAPWPGNVRELKNVVKRATLLAENDTITPDEIAIGEADRFIIPACQAEGMITVDRSSPGFARFADSARRAEASVPPSSINGKVALVREEIEKEELVKALRSAGGNKAKAARALKITRPTLYAKIKKYGLPPPST